MLRFETAGESHGECLVATLTGLPAGVPVSLEAINRDLWRRQQGYGRGGRMKIETDRAHIVSGVRHSKTIGSPVAVLIDNADWKNWTEALPVEDFEGSAEKQKKLTRPRPGHADLAGALKYNFHDARYVLERASARETTARVAVGGLAKAFLAELGMGVLSHVIAVGPERLDRPVTWDELVALSQRDEVLLNCVDATAEQRMKAVVDQIYKTGDTVGGVFEVVAHGVPPGLGSHIAWDTRLDGRLAQAIVSIAGGEGSGDRVRGRGRGVVWIEGAGHDPLQRRETQVHARGESRRGPGRRDHQRRGRGGAGIAQANFDAAATSGERGFRDSGAVAAAYERSDVCVVPAAGVVGEAMVALVLAQAALEKFGGDSIAETKRNYQGYLEQVKNF